MNFSDFTISPTTTHDFGIQLTWLVNEFSVPLDAVYLPTKSSKTIKYAKKHDFMNF